VPTCAHTRLGVPRHGAHLCSETLHSSHSLSLSWAVRLTAQRRGCLLTLIVIPAGGGGFALQAVAVAVQDILRAQAAALQLLRAAVSLRRAREAEAAAAPSREASTPRQEAGLTLLELLAHTERLRVQLRWLAGLCHCAVPAAQQYSVHALCRWQAAGDEVSDAGGAPQPTSPVGRVGTTRQPVTRCRMQVEPPSQHASRCRAVRLRISPLYIIRFVRV
jgi:hypothetical protein